MKTSYAFGILVSVVAIGAAGCDDGIPTYPVTGTVTDAGGTPIENAAVTFTHATSSEASAVGLTDASGVYTLNTKEKTGAQAGSYKVTIAKYEGGDSYDESGEEAAPAADPYDITNEYPENYDEQKEADRAAREQSKNSLPQRYSNPETSGLSADVTEGENTIDFQLEK